ncbi:MAG: hypothetical protein L3J26_04230, partial [Candidatus Polarisedimenticolaceae bacterium]|nr:hypothetical protein [Candidatus Polarisedimenticolaceae bacterium]
IIKLSPNQTDIAANAKGCIEAGADAFSVINTLMGMAIDIESRPPIIGDNQGGICNAEDAIEFLIAVATAVGIGTALFYDPLICPKINQGIQAYLERHELQSVVQLTGTLQLYRW